MARGRRTSAGQSALFEVAGIGPTAQGKARRHAARETVPEVIEWPGGIRPWDPIDEADRKLGYEFTYVSPRRAYEIRQEIERGIPPRVYEQPTHVMWVSEHG